MRHDDRHQLVCELEQTAQQEPGEGCVQRPVPKGVPRNEMCQTESQASRNQTDGRLQSTAKEQLLRNATQDPNGSNLPHLHRNEELGEFVLQLLCPRKIPAAVKGQSHHRYRSAERQQNCTGQDFQSSIEKQTWGE